MTASVETKVRSFDKLYIGGEWVTPATADIIDVISPVTEDVIAAVPSASPADVDAAVAAARRAMAGGPWVDTTPAERAAMLREIAVQIENRFAELVPTFAAEIGAPLAVSQAFHENALAMWKDCADLLETSSFEENREAAGVHVTVSKVPVGVVGIIIPWNGPVATASLKMAPALAAGCAVVLKTAPEGPVTAMIMAEAIEAAGLPAGVVSVLPGEREVGEYLVTHAGVDKISFTGSTAVGKRIMALCSDRLARVTLELGGKSAAIIADDIPTEEFLTGLAFAGIGHSGQVCAALTRILVPRHRHDEIVRGLVDFVESLPVGDPTDGSTVLGPLAAKRQKERVESYIQIGLDEGATLATTPRTDLPDKGWFVAPAVFSNVDNSMRIAQEEIFGPVICVIPFDSLDEAVALANDSDFGLSGAVYASDQALAVATARRIQTGSIGINTWGMCVTQPAGGFKQSGIGREGGPEGIAAYLETKVYQTAAS